MAISAKNRSYLLLQCPKAPGAIPVTRQPKALSKGDGTAGDDVYTANDGQVGINRLRIEYANMASPLHKDLDAGIVAATGIVKTELQEYKAYMYSAATAYTTNEWNAVVESMTKLYTLATR